MANAKCPNCKRKVSQVYKHLIGWQRERFIYKCKNGGNQDETLKHKTNNHKRKQ